jgi:hypothetical protein
MGYSWTSRESEVSPWLEAGLGQKYYLPGSFIGVKFDGRLILAVKYECFTGVSVQAHITKESLAYIPARFFHLIFWYPFIQLGVERVFISINSGNRRSLKLTSHMGFKEVARISGMLKGEDFIWFELLAKSCKFLEGSFRAKEALLSLEFEGGSNGAVGR